MNIREWTSNCAETLKSIPDNDRMQTTSTTVLGIQWDTQRDTLRIAKSTVPDKVTPTKRLVLQAIARVFDPLGLFSPVLLTGKLFVHSLWDKKMDWDQELTLAEKDEWEKLHREIMPISSFEFPRYLGPRGDMDSRTDIAYSLHCFCDASATAYGACVYVRVDTGTTISSHLLFAKSRLAPKRVITLPRTELLAAVIGTRCLEFVEKALTFPVTKFLWSDSQCVLHWIRSSKKLSVFVANRIRELRQTKNLAYRYVNTTDNPADIASRGSTMVDLKNCQKWWSGPSWLTLPDIEWPQSPASCNFDADTLAQIESETKPTVIFDASLLAEVANESNSTMPFGIDVNRYSTVTRLIRVTAWCRRFCQVIKSHKKDHPGSTLTANELKEARILWVKAIQKKHFGEVIKCVKDKKRHPLAEQLGLWLDQHEILRRGGRLTNSELSEAATHPMLLPRKEPFSTLVIRHYHERLFHTGVAHTLAQIRTEFWIPAGRSEVFRVIKDCRKCKRTDGGPYKAPNMPALPKERVTSSAPYTWTGLDYLGPLFVKKGNQTEKVWICLFTCMSTRAIHLELVEDMSTTQFLLALRRFIARRGIPSTILSDNAKQFKLAKSVLDKLWNRLVTHPDVQTYLGEKGIIWKFIVEDESLDPWMGGLYERLVRLVKQALRKSVGCLSLTPTQLQTILTEIEAMLNSRPLTYVGADFTDGMTLTPAHFLSLNPQLTLPQTELHDNQDPDYVPNQRESAKALLDTWIKGQKHLQQFWKIWKNDYLQSLRERTQNKLRRIKGENAVFPQVGDVVLVKSDLPRGTWSLARIEELSVSSDGAVRSAKILLPSGKEMNRSIIHLFPLECQDNKDETGNGNKSDTENESNHQDMVDDSHDDRDPGQSTRPSRQAATNAKDRIRELIKDGAV